MDRFAQYSLSTRLDVAPEELDTFDLRLLSEAMLKLDDNMPLPLHQLASASVQLSLHTSKAAKQLTALGFQIRGDRESRMDDTDYRLCGLRSRPSAPHSPLSLADPIADFLRIVRSGLAADDLVQRLERLGVDLDRVREAVRAALPKVPGLVMKPEPEPAAARPEAT
ncbi:hypothetical protein [Streptomyces sp. TRM68367]|uniref:wHTH domain-containing protein n=1 Tax=Streptomyces sp. TRM68367 TaxID=2758415 RepID=UPI00165AA87A|nr:hypothetical protein [Streptomyces sp. TRM68367]MBC9728517.1 hypothetical protein [Streptomyces sp. TRM68367]